MNTTSSNPAKAQVVTSVERRRRYTADQKIEILNESRGVGGRKVFCVTGS